MRRISTAHRPDDAKRPSFLRAFARKTPWFALALALLCAGSLHAQTLESKNPFLPPGYGDAKKEPPPPPPQTNGPISRELEFRGIVQLNGVLEYSLFHKAEQKGYWLAENQSQDGIQIRSYDRNAKALTVSMNGRTERLTLMSPNETPLPVASSINPAGNNRNPPELPPSLQNRDKDDKDGNKRRRVIPRRRVILPQN